MDHTLTPADRASALHLEQRQALLMIATGAPLAQCLDALTDAVARLAPGARGCVLLASEDRRALESAYSSHFPPAFAAPSGGCPSARR